jgi:translation initiation factor 3 subunit L
MGFPATSPPSTTTTTTTTDSRTTTSGGGGSNNNTNNNKEIPAVHTYLSLFSCIALSRLECLLADYTACLHALTPLAVHADYVIPKKDTARGAGAGAAETSGGSSGSAAAAAAASTTGSGSGGTTVAQVLQSTFTARLSLAYHAGVAYLMLRRYKDAITILGDMCAVMQRGFKTGALRKLAQSGGGGGGGGVGGGAGNGAGMLDQFNKQYERMLSLLALLVFSICPSGSASSAAATTMTAAAAVGSSSNSSSSSSSSSNNYFLLEDAVLRVLREKHASQLEAVSSNGNYYDDWFQSPKFICIDPQATSAFRHQVVLFGKEMQPMAAQRKLRSYLKLYTSLPVEKLAKFHDLHAVSEFLPLLLSYKMRMRQIERPAAAAAAVVGGDENKKGDHNNKSTATATTATVGYTDGAYKTALDIHYYVTTDNVVHMDEAEKQRRFENYFCAQIIQNEEILQDVLAIDTKV